MKLVSLAAAVLLAIPTIANAQSASAEALFKEGRLLIKQGKLAAGCDKLQASEAIESSVGTLLNLGDCREELGQTASAWAAFTKAEQTARRASDDEKRRAEAAKRASVLEPKLTRFTIQISGAPAGTVVKLNGDEVGAAAWNTALPVDPATYTISVEAPGYTRWDGSVTLAAGSKARSLKVPPLVAAPRTTATADASLLVPAAAVDTRMVTRQRTWSTSRGVAVGFVVAGVATLGTGIYFGMRSDELSDRADERCPLIACADPQALQDNSDARAKATQANILYAAGGGALAVAAVLWIAGRPSDEVVVAPAISSDGMGATLMGRF